MRFMVSGFYAGCEVQQRRDGDKYYVGVQQGLEICRMSCTKEVYDSVSKIQPLTPVVADLSANVFEGRLYYSTSGLSVRQKS